MAFARAQMQDYQPRMLSTYALTLFRHNAEIDGQPVKVDFWDTAGQERFNSMHPAYYHQAHACILCFDVTRKATYKNLPSWLKELRDYRSKIPTICIANKVDVDMKVMSKDFAFPKKHGMPLCEYRVELGHAQARAAPSSCHSCHSSLLSPPVFPPPPPLPALSLPFSSDVSAHASAFSSLLRDLPVLPFASFSLTPFSRAKRSTRIRLLLRRQWYERRCRL